MTKTEVNEMDLEKTAGGFPDGELPDENTRICPRCGTREDHLELIAVSGMDNMSYKIKELVTDHTIRLYKCKDCGFMFWQYGYFWEKY